MCYVLKNEYIYPCYISKCNLNHETQTTLLMIPDGEWWHFLLAVKKIFELLREVTLKHVSGFYCLNYWFRKKTKFNFIKKYVNLKILWCCKDFWRQ